jgi:hypothetical protein
VTIVARRMVKTLLFTLLVGGCIYFIWYVLSYELGLIDKEEASCFGVLLDGGYRLHQKYEGFSVLTVDIDSDCPPLVAMPVFSWEGEGYLYILPKARGITKVKYYFWKSYATYLDR